jgi:hypothetical protein
MADIIQNMISQLGQTQDQRLPAELDEHYAQVDERSAADLLRFARDFAGLVKFYDGSGQTNRNWKPFFPGTDEAALAMLRDRDGLTPAHQALFAAFLGLYKQPQKLLNRISGRHLNFYYEQVLRLARKPAVPDRAHVVIELKKLAPPIKISPKDGLSAGKDATGVELLYAPARETIINGSRVESLRTLYVDRAGQGPVRAASLANSSNGSGGKLNPDAPSWRGFGYPDLPLSEVGFAIGSPVLRLQEGERKVTIFLTLSGVHPEALNDQTLSGAFDVLATGEKGWISCQASVSLKGETMTLVFTVPATEKGVVDYSAVVHGYSYSAQTPIAQVLLNQESSTLGYSAFRDVRVRTVSVKVEVSGIKSLKLENDDGILNPKKPFLPFGQQPRVGSRFVIGCDEAFAKPLSNLSVKVHWKDPPKDFSDLYKTYNVTGISNDSFTASAAVAASGNWQTRETTLFDSGDARQEITFSFSRGTPHIGKPPGKARQVYALQTVGARWAKAQAREFILKEPRFSGSSSPALESESGFLTLALNHDFLHVTYRNVYVEKVVQLSLKTTPTPELPAEPYTPAIQSISLSYTARTEDVNVASDALADFANPEAQFYHVGYFGQAREHGYQRKQLKLDDLRVSLLPVFPDEGELLIGLAQLNPGDSVSILFQVVEGTGDPDLNAPAVEWSVLGDNHWKALGRAGVLLDTTNQLRTRGTIQFVIPAEASTANTILPAGLLWLRAGVTNHAAAMPQFIDVLANAIEARFADHGNDPRHLSAALSAGKLANFKAPLAPVKSVKQPFASFDGSPVETEPRFHTRVSERLRHKNRCLTPWDYERIVLEAFPRVHTVKCVPHAHNGEWLAPGYVLLVVIPDLRNQSGLDWLQPKVDANTITSIADWVGQRAGMQVKVEVKNPSYQRIQLDFQVKFRAGFEFNYYRQQLERQITEFLSPWAFAAGRAPTFGGRVYKSVLLDFVEDLPFVDWVTDFRMFTHPEHGARQDVNEAVPEAPDVILASEYNHNIREAT